MDIKNPQNLVKGGRVPPTLGYPHGPFWLCSLHQPTLFAAGAPFAQHHALYFANAGLGILRPALWRCLQFLQWLGGIGLTPLSSICWIDDARRLFTVLLVISTMFFPVFS